MEFFQLLTSYLSIDQLLLAGIQGFTEFLPVSSSSHIVLLGTVLRSEASLSFVIAAHFGTLMAAVIYLWRDILDITLSFFGLPDARAAKENRRTLILLIIATIPVGLGGFFLKDYYEEYSTVTVIAVTTITFGILLWMADKFALRVKNIENIGYLDALLLGLFQVLALIPGVSRSGITITALRFSGVTRKASVRFSFLCSLPVIAAAATLEVYQSSAFIFSWSYVITALIAFLVALISMHALIVWSSRASFAIFALYRVILGSSILWIILRV